MRLFLAISAVATSLLLLTSVASAAVDLQITALDCTSHPRRIRIENLGDETINLSGWTLQSDAAEGEPYDLGQVGSLDAGKKFFVFQGHLAPETSPSQGYFRWGTGEIFYLRGNDSSDYVRIVDPQGTVINQRNCEGLPPGATPAPPSEYDPPPVATPAPAVPTFAPATAAPTAAAQAAPAAPARVSPTIRPSGSASATPADPAIPALGGPPGSDGPASIPLASGAVAFAVGIVFLAAGFGRRRPGL